MCRSILFAFLTVLTVPWSARAQISVQFRMERDTLMLFESIPVTVTVHNFSGHTIDLANQGEAPWLNFLITDVSGSTISPVGNRPAPNPVKIAPGRTVSVAANLLPHYDLRQNGTFIVRAVVEGDGIHALSAPTRFTIIHGREIWKQTIGLPRTEGETNEEYRTYSLLLRRAENNEVLYAGVQDEAHDLIYGMIPLGDFIELGEPSARADNNGHLHVLYRRGPRSIGYAEIAPDAKVVKHVIYSDILSVPQLVDGSDGAVTVHGGEQVYPRYERMMTDEELKPRPPPPAKLPKKKWWWPFSPNKSQSPATNTTSAASATNAPSANFGPRS
jgi:hypothetical protein